MLKKYAVTVVGGELVGKNDCYVLELNSIKKKITYAKQKVWVDKERFVALKSQLFAQSGELLKEILYEKVQEYSNRYFATKVIMTNKIIKDRSTTFEMDELIFDADIPDGVFTKRYLER